MPCGYRINSETSSLTFATDLGYVSDEVFENLMASNYIVLESNYDNTLLDFGKYPYPTKRRIKGNLGHLSNNDTAFAITKLAKNGHKNFLLAHLSQNNNTPDIALNTIKDTLYNNQIDPNLLNIQISSKNLSNEVYTIC